MRRMGIRASAAALAAAIWTTPLLAHMPLDASVPARARLQTAPTLVLGGDGRRDAEAFAAVRGENARLLLRSHAASGVVQCGATHGAGQLTLANDVITTAAHVFFDERGAPRARTCEFVAEIDGEMRSVAIDLASIVAGSTQPYAVKAVHDWAVARLKRPLEGVKPYELAAGPIAAGDVMEFVARGHSDWGGGQRLSFEECRLRMQTNQAENGAREFAFDCATGDGASGGAALFGEDRSSLGAILVGWRSQNPMQAGPFSAAHYNFVISIEGAFRRAALAAAGTRDGAPGRLTASVHGEPAAGAPASQGASNRSAARE